MELIVHVGAHRTGTTTLQQFIVGNQDVLRAEDVACIGPPRTRRGLIQGLLGGKHTAGPARDRAAHRAAGLVHMLLAEKRAAGFQQVVLSEENLLGSPRLNLRKAALYPDAAWRFERMRPAFSPNLSRIVLSIRSYDSWWTSQLTRHVQLGGALPSEAGLDRLVTQPRRWRTLIEEIAAVWSDVEILVFPFERMAATPERALSLMTGIPLPPTAKGSRETHNSSANAAALATILRNRGQEAEADQLVSDAAGRWAVFPAGHSEILRAEYAEDLAWLRAGLNAKIVLTEDVGRAPHEDVGRTPHDETGRAPHDDDQRGQPDDHEKNSADVSAMEGARERRTAGPPT